ncbi:hypothetical protein HK100_004991, partial [Physocladia obscura]
MGLACNYIAAKKNSAATTYDKKTACLITGISTADAHVTKQESHGFTCCPISPVSFKSQSSLRLLLPSDDFYKTGSRLSLTPYLLSELEETESVADFQPMFDNVNQRLFSSNSWAGQNMPHRDASVVDDSLRGKRQFLDILVESFHQNICDYIQEFDS